MKIKGFSALSTIERFSVKVRILSLSLITAIGLVVIGGAFFWSQKQVDAAVEGQGHGVRLLQSVASVAEIGDQLHILEKGYLARPDPQVEKQFAETLAASTGALDSIRQQPLAGGLKAEIEDVQDTLEGVEGAFATLNEIQAKIGFDSETGLRAELAETAGGASQIILKEMNFGGGPDFEKLARAVAFLQLAEKEFILEGNDLALGNFEVAFAGYDKLIKKAYLPNQIKADIEKQMASYRTAFDAYTVQLVEKAKSVELLEDLFDLVPPHLHALNEAARTRVAATEQELQMVKTFSFTVMGTVILSMLIGLPLLATVIGRSISAPLSNLNAAMQKLANGETDVALPTVRGRNEIASMVQSVSVFRDNAIERRKLESASEVDNRERDARVSRLEGLISSFEGTVNEALASLDRATGELTQTSVAVEAAADDVTEQAEHASNAVRVASENVNSAASATEELVASINEIAGQANKSTDVAQQAVASAGETTRTMDELSQAADRIGEVMKLIRDIADQTNLLALNATIEAARAGEAGKGFAIVAAEVKQLADQTSKATGDIANQVLAIQGSSGQAMAAIEQVNAIIKEMEGLAFSVASAVEQQDVAVQSIARNVNDASNRSSEGAERMTAVGEATQHARQTGGEVELLAGSLREQAALIRSEIASFLEGVRAA
ncbi:methyl-accepting chemotaxis protein [Roseibium sp.]|uniref:methyl-accepting chemotaxis protein n=1 Tax=Roseibium sp. TaxID=1936156 RepID=UPI003A9707E3